MLYKLRPKIFLDRYHIICVYKGVQKNLNKLLRKIPTDHHFHRYSGSKQKNWDFLIKNGGAPPIFVIDILGPQYFWHKQPAFQ